MAQRCRSQPYVVKFTKNLGDSKCCVFGSLREQETTFFLLTGRRGRILLYFRDIYIRKYNKYHALAIVKHKNIKKMLHIGKHLPKIHNICCPQKFLRFLHTPAKVPALARCAAQRYLVTFRGHIRAKRHYEDAYAYMYLQSALCLRRVSVQMRLRIVAKHL